MSWCPLVIGQNASRQLTTTSENSVTSVQFLVALATSESQLQALCPGSRNGIRRQQFYYIKQPYTGLILAMIALIHLTKIANRQSPKITYISLQFVSLCCISTLLSSMFSTIISVPWSSGCLVLIRTDLKIRL